MYSAKEDLIYNSLDEEKKKAVRDKAIEELRSTNPSFENPSLGYMREFLINMKIREVINLCNIGGARDVNRIRL